MYGVTDFALMRAGNAYFVDRTDLIRELEKTRYTVFLRPRRFGKSLLVSILQCYYDVDYAHRFDELFGGLRIAANPTAERGRYLALIFNFSGVEQLVRYARDKDIAREWNLKAIPNVTGGVPGGTVELHRILVVFHGGQVVVCDEI